MQRYTAEPRVRMVVVGAEPSPSGEPHDALDRLIRSGGQSGVEEIMGALGVLSIRSESDEEVDPGVIEAIRATGGNPLQVVVQGVIPQAMPTLVSWSIFRLDINIRYSWILGIVGAGGIGWELSRSSRMGDDASAITVTLVIFLTVYVIELITDQLRKRVQ